VLKDTKEKQSLKIDGKYIDSVEMTENRRFLKLKLKIDVISFNKLLALLDVFLRQNYKMRSIGTEDNKLFVVFEKWE